MYLVVEDINTLAKVVTVLFPIFSSSLFINSTFAHKTELFFSVNS